jgi:hypothetical protein
VTKSPSRHRTNDVGPSKPLKEYNPEDLPDELSGSEDSDSDLLQMTTRELLAELRRLEDLDPELLKLMNEEDQGNSEKKSEREKDMLRKALADTIYLPGHSPTRGRADRRANRQPSPLQTRKKPQRQGGFDSKVPDAAQVLQEAQIGAVQLAVQQRSGFVSVPSSQPNNPTSITGFKLELRSGDWMCGFCKTHNFKRNIKCFRCPVGVRPADPAQ